MDKFTKSAFIGCVVVCAIVLVFFYIGSALGYTDIAGIDGKVEGQAAKTGNKETQGVFYELDQNGEYVGFLLVGMVGGFVVGYAWVVVFEESDTFGGKPRG